MSSEVGSIRRSAIERVPIYRRVFRPEPVRRMPTWLRNLLLGLLLLLLFLVCLVACHESEKPEGLATSTLAGPRLVTGPVCIEEAVDVSGSMDAYRAERERAERELFAFARRELTPDDRMAEAFFAGSGKLALAPTSISSLRTPPRVPGGIDYNGTMLAPAVEAFIAARPAGQTCAARALVVITDGQFFDDPADLSATLTRGNYTRMFAVIPSDTGWGRPAPLSGGVLDSIVVHHFHGGGWSGRAASVFDDAKPLDVILGDVVGSLTGQKLEPAEHPATPAPSPSAPSR